RGAAGAVRMGARNRYADQRERHHRRGLRNELLRIAPDLRNAVHRLHRLRVQSDYEFCGQGTLPVECACAHGDSRAVRRRRARRAVPLGQSGDVFCATPGLKVIYPSTPYDAKGLLKAAVRDNNPVLFFEHKFLYRRIKEALPAEDYTVPIGKAVVRREGKHLTIISYAAMMHTSLEAAVELEKEGIDAEVIDLRTLLPLDEETILASLKKTNKCLVVHEDTKTGGIAGEIAAILCERAFGDLDGPLLRVTALDTPVPYAPSLEEHFLPNKEKVLHAARALAKY